MRSMSAIPRSGKMYRGTPLSLGGGTSRVALDTVLYDTAGDWSPGTCRWVCSQKGLYAISAEIGLPASAANCQPVIYKNGTGIYGGTAFAGSASGGGGVITALLILNPGDTIELYAWVSTAMAINSGPTNTWMEITMIQSLGRR